jgi:hypothetical protein
VIKKFKNIVYNRALRKNGRRGVILRLKNKDYEITPEILKITT